MAKRMPIIDTGIVEPSIAKSTVGNFGKSEHQNLSISTVTHHVPISPLGFIDDLNEDLMRTRIDTKQSKPKRTSF